MSVSYWMDKSSCRQVVAKDVVIIGGGITGHSLAFWLLKEDPHLKIALVDQTSLGHGASGRNAGFITCGSVEHFNRLVSGHGKTMAHQMWSFSEQNLRLLQEEIIQERGSQLFFEKKGSFSLASSEKEFQELKNSQAIMESLKIPVEIIQQNQIEKRLGAKHFVGGIKYHGDASVHPLKLLELMLSVCQEKSRSLEVFEQTQVYAIENQGENKLIKTNHQNINAPIVILATNAYSGLLAPFFKDKIYPTKGQILITEPIKAFMEGPCYANFVLDYFRQLPTGELLIGGFRQLEKETQVGYSDHTTEIIQQALFDFIQKHLPLAQGKKITHRWGGIMGFSSDGQPMIGSLPTDSQVFFAGGMTAHGLGLAFHVSKCLVDLIYGRPIPEFISAKRF